ncbi:hypothetical protein [uncultured Algibacter sp.]|uniref:hypothetical protein n=1 Tax=uncultured Algibacter sp. TaxID=298659 RepID=UPI0026112042|nr:hypothetical protein [uncultured Algibacter sp.]
MKYHLLLLIKISIFSLLFSCKSEVNQELKKEESKKEIISDPKVKIHKKYAREPKQLEQSIKINRRRIDRVLYLAAAKLCRDYNYNNTFGSNRIEIINSNQGKYLNSEGNITKQNCCTEFFPEPFISPMEYYYYLFYGETEIIDNKNNVFALEKIRKNPNKEDYEFFKETLKEIDTENLFSNNLIRSSLMTYDFKSKTYPISIKINEFEQIGVNFRGLKLSPLTSTPKGLQKRGNDFYFFLHMEPDEAEKLFNSSGNELSTDVTYSLSIPEKQIRPYSFVRKIKNIVWYSKDGEMVAEVNL